MFCAKELRKHRQNSLKGSRFDILLRVIFPFGKPAQMENHDHHISPVNLGKTGIYSNEQVVRKKGVKF